MRVDLVHGVEICPPANFGSDIFGHVEVSRETISPWCWWIAVNMMYSDYYGVASHFGVATPEFFAEFARVECRLKNCCLRRFLCKRWSA